MDFSTLMSDAPQFHTHDGSPISWQVCEGVLKYLEHSLHAGASTLETGAGVSTVVFALKQTRHICITPDADQVSRIQAYCTSRQISLDQVSFQIEPSERILPELRQTVPEQSLDLVLIDGRHAFPTPFIDWYYTADLLKVGGKVIVDDTHLWTGHILKEFLALEPEWQLQMEWDPDSPRAALLTKLATGSHQKWWGEQPRPFHYAPSLAVPSRKSRAAQFFRNYVSDFMQIKRDRARGQRN